MTIRTVDREMRRDHSKRKQKKVKNMDGATKIRIFAIFLKQYIKIWKPNWEYQVFSVQFQDKMKSYCAIVGSKVRLILMPLSQSFSFSFSGQFNDSTTLPPVQNGQYFPCFYYTLYVLNRFLTKSSWISMIDGPKIGKCPIIFRARRKNPSSWFPKKRENIFCLFHK